MQSPVEGGCRYYCICVFVFLFIFSLFSVVFLGWGAGSTWVWGLLAFCSGEGLVLLYPCVYSCLPAVICGQIFVCLSVSMGASACLSVWFICPFVCIWGSLLLRNNLCCLRPVAYEGISTRAVYTLYVFQGLKCILPKFTCGSPNPPEPQNVTLYGNRVLAEVMSSTEVTLEHSGPLIQ